MVGEKIKAWRKYHGYTRHLLAHQIGIETKLIRSFEVEEIVPPSDMLEEIIDALGITVYELYNGPPEPTSPEEVIDSIIPEKYKKPTETLAEASVETENWSQSEGGKHEKVFSEPVSVPDHYAEVSVELGESSQTIENQEWKRAVVRITIPCPLDKLEETKQRVANEAREFLKQQTKGNMDDSAEYWKGKLGL
jgi:transcriptional regulator with XRE-family HTH domain